MTDTNTTPGAQNDPFKGLMDANPFDQDGGAIDADMYDTLMKAINPELTTEGLKTLDEKYKNETLEEAKARGEKYEQDFAEYDRQAQQQFNKMKSASRMYHRKALNTVEHMEREDEEVEMTKMEKAMDAA